MFSLSLNVKLLYLTHRALWGANTPDQSEPSGISNEGVLRIPQSTRAGVTPSDCLMSSWEGAGYFGFIGGACGVMVIVTGYGHGDIPG